MTMRHFRLDSVLNHEEEEIHVADRVISCDHLHVYYGQTKLAKHFALGSS